jgi:amino acid transporter
MFVAVLGVALTTADPLTLYLTYTNHIFGPGSWEKWFVGLPLIAALALSVLNAIMGCGRSLFQAAEDGQLPRWFQKKNRHGVPGQAMAFNVVCSAILVLLGSPLRIYIISNGGYLLSCSLALAGYFVYRQLRPDVPRPFRLPTFAKWIALLIFVAWMAIYFFGGWNSPKIILADPHQGPGLYLLGLLIVALYAPLYWWRAWQDRRRAASPALAVTADGTTTGATSLTGAAGPTGATGLTGATDLTGATGDPVAGAESPVNEPPTAR